MLFQKNKIETYQSSPIFELILEIKSFIADKLGVGIKEVEVAPIGKFEFGNFSVPLHKLDSNIDMTSLVSGLKAKFRGDGIGDVKLVGKYINFYFNDKITQKVIEAILAANDYGCVETLKGRKIMVEYSSPNTNKPLHLGHIRNNVLGMAIANLLVCSGAEVIKACLINDRGIHICKSMWAYIKFGKGKTPQSEGIKGDLFVGNFYVMFEKELNKEKMVYIDSNKIKVCSLSKIELDKLDKDFTKQSNIYSEAQDLLIKWEKNDSETIGLWKKMNRWVYEGFAVTYTKLGSKFDVENYESEIYLLGKKIVMDYLEKGLLEKKNDGSIGINLADGSFKVLLRNDGTSVYMTQDIGTAKMRINKYDLDNTIYVVGDEQNYHFIQLFQILEKLGLNENDSLYHLGHGMVELPSGKMKSREGNVVDADVLIDGLTTMAKEKVTNQNGKVAEDIALAAIKYYMLKSNPRTKLLFDPQRSLDFEGLTGPYLQYTYARINSILEKIKTPDAGTDYSLLNQPIELEIVSQLSRYSEKLIESADQLDPSILANYLGDLAIKFNRWYHNFSVSESEDKLKKVRLYFIEAISKTLAHGLIILGIKPLDEM